MSRPRSRQETGSIDAGDVLPTHRRRSCGRITWQDMTWDGMFLLTWNQIAPDAPGVCVEIVR